MRKQLQLHHIRTFYSLEECSSLLLLTSLFPHYFKFFFPLIRFSFICLSLSYRNIHPYSLHPPIYPSTLLFYLSLLIFFFSFFFLFFLFFFFIFLFIFYLFFFSFFHQHFGHSPYSSIHQSVHTSC